MPRNIEKEPELKMPDNSETADEKIKKEIEKIEEPEYQGIDDISFKKVQEDDPDFNKAREVVFRVDKSEEMVQKRVEESLRQDLIKENWWLKSEWAEKGIPKEQIEVEIEDRKIDIYNFGECLTDKHLEKLEKIIKEFSQIQDGESLNEARYILIDNIPKTNPRTGEDYYGHGAVSDRAIKLYPRGLKFSPYRIEGVSSFEAVVIHELTHNITEKIINDWIKKFGWKSEGEDKEGFRIWKSKKPEKCINDYARLNPEDDICESMVATLRNPKLLDPERLKSLKDILSLDEIGELKTSKIDLQKRREKEIKLPKLESPVKYKLKKYLIKDKKVEWVSEDTQKIGEARKEAEKAFEEGEEE